MEQVLHTVSEVAVQLEVWKVDPLEQLEHATHDVCRPAVGMNVPEAQALHVVSVVPWQVPGVRY